MIYLLLPLNSMSELNSNYIWNNNAFMFRSHQLWTHIHISASKNKGDICIVSKYMGGLKSSPNHP